MVESRPAEPCYSAVAVESNSAMEDGHEPGGHGPRGAVCSCTSGVEHTDSATNLTRSAGGQLRRPSSAEAEVEDTNPGASADKQTSHHFSSGSGNARDPVRGASAHAAGPPHTLAGPQGEFGPASGENGMGEVASRPFSGPSAPEGIPRLPPERAPAAGTSGSHGPLAAAPALSAGLGNGMLSINPVTIAPLAQQITKPQGQTLVQAAPYDHARLGAPAPPCEASRAATAAEVFGGALRSDPEFDCMLRVLSTVFNTETAYISLITGDAIYLPSACGAIPPGVKCPRDRGMCAWTCASPVDEVMVIEDTRKDARFQENEHSDGRAASLVFYVAAPLITTTGHRIGTMCIAAPEPRTFDQQKSGVLLNLSELVTRRLEKAFAMRQAAIVGQSKLMRSIDCYTRAYLFLSVDADVWNIIHMNTPAMEMTGVTFRDPIPFSALFEVQKTSQDQLYRHFRMGTRVDGEFSVTDVTLKKLNPGDEETPALQHKYCLCFKPAGARPLDKDAAPVGIPAYVKTGTTLADKYFFVELSISSYKAPGESVSPPQTPPKGEGTRALKRGAIVFRPSHIPIEGLVLGVLLGKGGYGRVYQGTYNGKPVAVKVIFDLARAAFVDGLPLEMAVAAKVRHRAIVRTLAYDLVEDSDKAEHTSNSYEGWIVMELMDRGSLGEAILKGWLRTECSVHAPTDKAVVYRVAYDIADAMAELHRQNIMHGDLSSQNVMLQRHDGVPHGFRAKVADFGLARIVDFKMRVSSTSYGTVTHVAPEVLTEGLLSKAADVYAWGVICWECISNAQAWAGMSHAQIVYAVGMMKTKLQFDPSAPAAFVQLARRCLSYDYKARPSFEEVVEQLALVAREAGIELA